MQTHSYKGQKSKNRAAEQRSSPQGCTVRAKTIAGQSSLGIHYPLATQSPFQHTKSFALSDVVLSSRGDKSGIAGRN
jgi:hypothetical protein